MIAILKYKVIKDKEQYESYCRELESLIGKHQTPDVADEVELLTLLIEKYDSEINTFEESDPVMLLKSLMQDHQMKAKDLVDLLEVSKGYVSDILHYRKGMSKETIRKLADYFKMNQKAFNRPYELVPMQLSSSNQFENQIHAHGLSGN